MLNIDTTVFATTLIVRTNDGRFFWIRSPEKWVGYFGPSSASAKATARAMAAAELPNEPEIGSLI